MRRSLTRSIPPKRSNTDPVSGLPRTRAVVLLLSLLFTGCVGSEDGENTSEDAAAESSGAASGGSQVLDLWAEGLPAFGVYVPNEGPAWDRASGDPRPAPVYTAAGGRALAENPLYDFVFLNLEGAYNTDAVVAIGEGLRSATAVGQKTFLVRIPPMSDAGEETTRARVDELVGLGVDGVILPHIRSVEEARFAIGLFESAGADVWSPANPDGAFVVMLMLEDPDAVAQAETIANLPGYSMLSCGIGSLTGALGGDREAAHAGAMQVLAEATAAGLTSMMTANPDNIDQRMEEGFLGILTMGASADDVIRRGRELAGR